MSSSSPMLSLPNGRLAAPKTWTADDLRLLRELAGQGVPPGLIAAHLRKTESAVRNKAMMQGVSFRRR